MEWSIIDLKPPNERTAACPSLDGRSLVKLEHAKNQKRQRKKIVFGLQKIIMLGENKPIVSKVDLLPKFKENIITDFILKVSKSQKHFFLKLHCQKSHLNF